ncbi:MAG: alpha/beta hydrolase [Bacteroidota bacterium]
MQTKNLIYEDATIFYRITGEGKPVVLVHGFGEDGEVWEKQIEVLQQNFLLIIPDLPGSGHSTYLQNADIDTYAAIMKAILDKESIENCTMVGHSMGGYTTLAFAEKYPAYLNAFVLFHSSAFADNDEKKETRKKAIEFIQNNGAHNFLKTSTPGLFISVEKSNNYINELLEKGKNFTAAALIQYYEAMIKRPDRTTILKSFDKPVLFIIGEHDKAIPLESSLQQCHFPAISHVHILKNSAHMGMYEETAKANGILQDFLKIIV